MCRVWVVSDGDSLTPVTPVASDTQPAFGEVVKATPPVAISAGDGIGHMGFFQLPEDNGKLSRYQVHLECLSPGDKLVTFLTNPDNVDVNDKAAYLKYEKDAALFMKNGQGQIVASTRRTRNQGIATRSKVATLGADGQPVAAGAEPAYYQINVEFGWLAAASIRKVSQYALGELGFVTLDKTPESFDLIDGIKQPHNVVKGILEQMYQAASDETRSSHAMNEYNYKRLLEQIDANHDGHYSEGEYLQAVHNRSYRDHLYRIIAKHGSEWYYGKDDPLWDNYLKTLTTDAPEWKKYTEAFIDKITWMKEVPDMEEKPWHMHPLVLLDSLKSKPKTIGRIVGNEFVQFVWEEAKKNEAISHVPAAITTAQAILETGYGRSVPTDLYTNEYSYNLFGIKAHGNPNFVQVWTHEVQNGVRIRIIDKFQKYTSYEDSIAGRAAFFTNNRRYHFLFDYDDPCDWATGLQQAGYATDPTYADKLISIMRTRGLL